MKKLVYLFIAVLIGSCKPGADVAPEPKPEVFFSITDKELGFYQFNLTAKNTTQFMWDFGDGGSSSESNPQYRYTRNGNFTVRLTGTGKGGTTTFTKSVSVATVPGTVTFWMKSGKYKVDVTIDNKYLTTITSNYSSRPACDAQGTASFTYLNEGIHSFTAKEVGPLFPSKWSGTISIVGGLCVHQELLN